MAEWLYEEGIGENRAALLQDGEIVEAVIELPSAVRAGAIVPARLATIVNARARAIALLESGVEVLVEPVPRQIAEGARVRLEIVREAVLEPGRSKRAKGRVTDAPERDGPGLLERLRLSSLPVRTLLPAGRDPLEEAGWSQLLEEASTGDISFPRGSLRMSVTPAMTLFDVDGTLAAADLAVAGAREAARAIRRMSITGSIGIDLPTLAAKEDRAKAAAALDEVLPQPFERTAVNGFGFLQVVRRRERSSLPELLQGDSVGAAARAMLRAAERATGSGLLTLSAAPAVVSRLEQIPSWLDSLRRRTGTEVALQADPALAISAWHVHRQLP